VLLCPAGLTPIKGHKDLLQAMRILQARGIDCDLWLAGDGNQRRKIVEQGKALKVGERIRFLGCVPHQDLLNLYQTGPVECVALASLHEGIPVSLMEAMSYEVPVVATSVGGTPELLSDGCGVLVPPSDPEALAGGLFLLLTDRVLRDRVACAGRKRIEARFGAGETAEKLSRLFQETSSGNSTRDTALRI